jgi:hypothetical protein
MDFLGAGLSTILILPGYILMGRALFSHDLNDRQDSMGKTLLALDNVTSFLIVFDWMQLSSAARLAVGSIGLLLRVCLVPGCQLQTTPSLNSRDVEAFAACPSQCGRGIAGPLDISQLSSSLSPVVDTIG